MALTDVYYSNERKGSNPLVDAITGGVSAVTDKLVGVLGPGSGSAPRPWGGGSGSGGDDEDGGGGGGGGFWYGGGYGSSGPTDNDRKAVGNLGAIVGENAANLRDQFDNAMNNLDIADKQNQYLRDANIKIAKQAAGNDWFRQYLKTNHAGSEIVKKMSNALRGSALFDVRDLFATVNDMIAAETLDTQRENVNQTLLSYYEALAQNVNSRNEMAADTESSLRELYADYLAQVNNIHPDLVADKLDTENHSVKPVDWLDTDFYGSHVTQAAKPETQGLYRPDRANTTAVEGGTRTKEYNTASSAVSSYWDRMNRGYDQRTRQA